MCRIPLEILLGKEVPVPMDSEFRVRASLPDMVNERQGGACLRATRIRQYFALVEIVSVRLKQNLQQVVVGVFL